MQMADKEFEGNHFEMFVRSMILLQIHEDLIHGQLNSLRDNESVIDSLHS